jgi:hypothetical protein
MTRRAIWPSWPTIAAPDRRHHHRPVRRSSALATSLPGVGWPAIWPSWRTGPVSDIDITNPASPAFVAFITRQGMPRVAVAGNLVSWRTTIPAPDHQHHQSSQPTPVGTYDTPGYAYGVAVEGDLPSWPTSFRSRSSISVIRPVCLAGSYDTPGLYGVAVENDWPHGNGSPVSRSSVSVIRPADIAGSWHAGVCL